MTTDLVLDDVALIRGSGILVDGLDTVVAPGQTPAVTGASGAGKTTPLKVISGPSLCSHEPMTWPEGRLAQVFQEPRPLPWYSAHHNVVLVVSGETLDLIAQQWLVRVNFQQTTRLYPRRLSGGMRQRVAIAQVMATNPTPLFVGEPSSALNRPLAMVLRTDPVRLLTEQEVVTVWVVHDPEEADDVSRLHPHLDGPPGTRRFIVETDPVPDPEESIPDKETS